MLDVSVIDEVARLIREGRLSQRRIAKKLGISRGIVGAVANGTRSLFGMHANKENAESVEQTTSRLPERCPGCGGRVLLPCVYCRAQAYLQQFANAGLLTPAQAAKLENHEGAYYLLRDKAKKKKRRISRRNSRRRKREALEGSPGDSQLNPRKVA